MEGNGLTYAITIYAILPTIVIVLLFNFLTDLDRQVAQYEGMLINNGSSIPFDEINFIKKKLRGVDKFIIVSSRYLHLTMSFYLIFLLGSFGVEIFSISHKIIIGITIITYFFYAIFYTYIEADIIARMELEYKWLYYGIHSLSFFVIPLISLFMLNALFSLQKFYILWISINILQISLWWLIFPVKDKPLSSLNIVSKEILSIKYLQEKGSSFQNKNIFDFIHKIEKQLEYNWSIFQNSDEFKELEKIHNILNKSENYSRTDRCKFIPYPPYHLGAQLIGKGINKIFINYNYISDVNFPGLIEESIEFEMENEKMLRRFKMDIWNNRKKIFTLYIEFEHDHANYSFISKPKVFVK